MYIDNILMQQPSVLNVFVSSEGWRESRRKWENANALDIIKVDTLAGIISVLIFL